jgi:micrococcal nuclease
MAKAPKGTIVGVLIAAAVLVGAWAGNRAGLLAPSSSETAATATSATVDVAAGGFSGTVSKIADGDTITVVDSSGTKQKVRLLGIDTPEIAHNSGETAQCGGPEATAAITALIPVGTAVTITLDPNSDAQDRYDRWLGYVASDTVPDVGLELLKSGVAGTYVPSSAKKPVRFDSYTEAEQQARDAQIGSWAACETLGRG